MWDISKFIDKETLVSSPRDTWDLLLLEHELERIERTILFAHAKGYKSAVVFDASPKAIEFLKEKGYTVTKTPDGCEIWLI